MRARCSHSIANAARFAALDGTKARRGGVAGGGRRRRPTSSSCRCPAARRSSRSASGRRGSPAGARRPTVDRRPEHHHGRRRAPVGERARAARASPSPMRRWRAPARPRSAASSASWSARTRRCSRASSRCCATSAPTSPIAASVGCGQVVKLINNALVFENTVALAEMMVLGERAGVQPAMLLDAVSKGSGDSFVLRNHGTQGDVAARVPGKVVPARIRAQGHRLRAGARGRRSASGPCHRAGAALLRRGRRQGLRRALLSRR